MARAQSKFDYFYLEAEKCRLAQDYSSAFDLFRYCLELRPDAPEALYNVGLLHLYLRQDSIGTDYIRRAAERDANNPYYLEALASLYVSKRNAEAAIPVLEKMAAIQSRRSDVLSQLATLYRTTGETDKAIGALNRIELLEGISPQVSLEKFSLYQEKEQPDSAFMVLQALCDDAPHDMNLRTIMGVHYMKAGDTIAAMKIYDEVRQKEPSNANVQVALLDYYRDQGQEQRYSHMRDSLLFDPKSSSQLRTFILRYYIADVQRDSTLKPQIAAAFDTLLSQPQYDTDILMIKAAYQSYDKQSPKEICATLRSMLDVDPGNQTALFELLKYYAKENDDKGVEDICRRGLNYHPEEIAYAYYLGLALSQQEKYPEAIEVFQQGIRVRNEDTSPYILSDAFAAIGDIYHKLHREEEAFAAYDSALVYRDDNAMCLNNYAYFLSLKEKDLDRAEEMSYRTIRLQPDNKTFLDTYAWILFMKQDYKHARSYMDKVLPPEKTNEDLLAEEEVTGVVFEHAGDIAALSDDMEAAIRFWLLAKEKDDGSCTPQLRKKLKKKKYIK